MKKSSKQQQLHNKVFHRYIQNLTTPKNTNISLAQVTLQSTVKPSVAPKYSHMDYQTYRPMTVPSKTRRTSQETLLQNTIITMHIRQKQTIPHEKLIIITYVLTIGIIQ